MSTSPAGPLIETSYPGQPKAIIEAPPHILEHYRKHPDSELPFVQPVGKFKELLDKYRPIIKKHREMLDRDSPSTK